MKTGIHPELYDVVFVDTSSGAKFISQSTVKTDETMKINGKDHYVIKVEFSSDTHPFYTGKQKLIDTSGRVDKFRAKMKKAQELAEKNVKKVEEGSLVIFDRNLKKKKVQFFKLENTFKGTGKINLNKLEKELNYQTKIHMVDKASKSAILLSGGLVSSLLAAIIKKKIQ